MKTLGPVANLRAVRRLGRAYDRAIREEEEAETLGRAWKLAKVSERALHELRCAQNGVAFVRRTPTNPRTRAKAGLAARAMFGRAIARAVAAKAGLAKARLANAARVVARKARRAMRAALRFVAVAVLASPLLLACAAEPVNAVLTPEQARGEVADAWCERDARCESSSFAAAFGDDFALCVAETKDRLLQPDLDPSACLAVLETPCDGPTLYARSFPCTPWYGSTSEVLP